MPDHFHIPATIQNSGRHKRTMTMDESITVPVLDVGTKSGSLLSKHNGWITVEPEQKRSAAPETFQNSNPMQKNRLKPQWMRLNVNQSLDIERYKRCAIDLSSSCNGLNKSMQSITAKKNREVTSKVNLTKTLTASTERMKIRDMAIQRRGEHLELLKDFPTAGKSTANYGKHFAYLQGCLPGQSKLDSSN